MKMAKNANNRIKLTKKNVESIPFPPESANARRSYQDTEDRYLHLVVTRTVRSWRYIRKIGGRGGRMRFITLGHYPNMTPDQARKASELVSADFTKGIDPGEERKINRTIPTWEQLFEWYLENHAKPHKRTWKYDVDMESLYCQAWRSRRHSDISTDVVTRWHKHLGQTKGKHQADRVLAMVKTVFSKAIAADVIQGRNPAAHVTKFFSSTDEYSRDRHLDGGEIGRLLKTLTAYHDQDIADFFMVLLFTGARKSNVMAMRWDDMNQRTPDRAAWTIPAPQSKNKAPMVVQIVEPVISILNRRYENRRSDEWVFPSRNGAKSKHLTEPKKAWATICEQADLKDVRMHDLRRTLGSWQASLGTSLQIIGKSLGHRSTKSTEIYARLDVDPVRASVAAAAAAMLKEGNQTLPLPQAPEGSDKEVDQGKDAENLEAAKADLLKG